MLVSLFLKGPFFQIIRRSQQLSLFLCDVGKTSPCVYIYSYSVPSAILGPDEKQNTTFKLVLGGVRIFALSICSHEQSIFSNIVGSLCF